MVGARQRRQAGLRIERQRALLAVVRPVGEDLQGRPDGIPLVQSGLQGRDRHDRETAGEVVRNDDQLSVARSGAERCQFHERFGLGAATGCGVIQLSA